MMERRRALGGSMPKRTTTAAQAARRCRPTPPFAELRSRLGRRRRSSTTMGFTRLLRNLARDEHVGQRVVPIIPDEARTFGMDALFRELKIYAARARSTSRSTTTCCCRTPSRPTARSSRRASPRPARWPASSPPAPRYATRGVPMVPVLHVLFDVRLPARRRPHLAGGRHPRPRLPDGRHRRAHDAARRGPAAPGRPQPRARLDGAGRAGLRPGVRLRGRRHRPGRASTGCTAPTHAGGDSTATSSTTSPSTTRTT